MKFIVAIALFLLAASLSKAATVCSTGADYTDGVAALSGIEPGAELLFCAGETFQVGAMYALGDLEGAYVGAYGEGDPPLLEGGMYFRGGPTSHITFEGLHFRGDGTGQGFRIDGLSSDITIRNSEIEGFGVGIYIRKVSGAHQNITIEGNLIHDNTYQGTLGGGPGLYIGHNTIWNNGSGVVYDHNIYAGCSVETPHDELCPVLIEHNTLWGSSRNSQGHCVGTEIVFHGNANGLVIQNNVISEPAGRISNCYGIAVSPGYPIAEYLQNIQILDNSIDGVGRIGISIEESEQVVIAGNTITNSNAGEFTMIGVQVKGSPGGGQVTEASIGGSSAQDILIENNSISLNGLFVQSIRIWDDVLEPIVIQGNTIEEVNPCDPNDDGGFGLDDVGYLLVRLGQVDACVDYNEDGAVGLDDLAFLLTLMRTSCNNWLHDNNASGCWPEQRPSRAIWR